MDNREFQESPDSLLHQLIECNSAERIDELKELITNDKYNSMWTGPFSWKVLTSLCSCNNWSLNTNVMGRISWFTIQKLIIQEDKLKIKRFDLEKLISNLTAKALDFQEYYWALRFASFLAYRLSSSKSKKRSKFDFDAEVRRDELFIPCDNPKNEILLKLCVLTNSYILRCISADKISKPSIYLKSFDTTMLIECSWEFFELFVHHWRLSFIARISIDSTEIEKLVLFEKELFDKSGHDLEKITLLKVKNILAYIKRVDSSNQFLLEPLWNFNISSHCEAEILLSMTAGCREVEFILKWNSLHQVDCILLRVDREEPFEEYLPTSISLSTSCELWLFQRIGKRLSAQHFNIKELMEYLSLLIRISTIRHELSFKVFDCIIRSILKQDKCSLFNHLSFLEKIIKRLIKLGIHFSIEGKTFQIISAMIKLSWKHSLIEVSNLLFGLLDVPQWKSEESIMCAAQLFHRNILEQRGDVFPKTSNIFRNLIDLLCNNMVLSLPLIEGQVLGFKDHNDILYCHVKVLSSKDFSNAKVAIWKESASSLDDSNNRQLLCYIWSLIAGEACPKPAATADQGALSEILKNIQAKTFLTEADLILHALSERPVAQLMGKDFQCSILYSKYLYSCGHFHKSFQTAKGHYETLIEKIKKGKHTLIDLQTLYRNLINSLQWLTHLAFIARNQSLYKYYQKCALHYCDNLKLVSEKVWFEQVGLNREINTIPGKIEDVVYFLDNRTKTSIPQSSVKNILIESSNSAKCEDIPFKSDLKAIWNCGRPDQLRDLVCRIIAVNESSVLCACLMSLVIMKETVNLDFNPPNTPNDFDNLILEIIKAVRAKKEILFMDITNNIVYYYCSSSPVFSTFTPMLIRYISPFSLSNLFVEWSDFLEANKRQLFSPSSCPVNDNLKRQWWTSRYETQKALESVLLKIESIVWPLKVFGSHAVNNSTLKVKNNLYYSPFSLKLNIVLQRMKSLKSETLQRNILGLLGFSVDDIEQILLKELAGEQVETEMMEEWNPFSSSEKINSDNTKFKEGSLVMVDRFWHQLPFESCHCLKNIPIIRLISPFASVNEIKWLDRVGAIVNPGGDLIKTEETVDQFLRSELGLSPEVIIKGRAPSQEEMKEILTAKELALYFGHGTGEAYLPSGQIATLNPCASSFLFGCSSGRLKGEYPWNPEGALLAYHSAHSPLVLVNLWDVTDKDIDKLSIKFLKSLRLDDDMKYSETAESLMDARSACTLRYLNGAAPVLYSFAK